MKFKYITLLIMISYFGRSQNNLFNSTANWSISSYTVNMFCITNDVYSSFFIGDTIIDIIGDTSINTNHYYKLYKSGNRFNQSGCPSY